MHILFLLLITILAFSFLFYLPGLKIKNESRRNTVYLIIVFGFLGIVHVFKNTHSIPDVDLYIDGFKEISQCNLKTLLTENLVTLKAEKGYILLNKLILIFTNNPFGLVLITSLIILSGYFYSIRKYSPLIALSILLYIMGPYVQSIYVLRQHIAMSILLFTYPFIINRQLYKFLIVVLLAFSIHQSAIVFLPVYFIYGIKKIRTIFILGGAFVALVVFNMESLIEYFIQKFFMDYVSYLQDDVTNWKNFALLFSVFLLRFVVLKTPIRFQFKEVVQNISVSLVLFPIAFILSSYLSEWNFVFVYMVLSCVIYITIQLALGNSTIKMVCRNIRKK